jgi:hypothetical protein
VLPRFYIFKNEILKNDYIKLYKPSTHMEMQKKACMTCFLFKKFLSFFKRSILGGMSLTNWQLLILNGYGSHITL